MANAWFAAGRAAVARSSESLREGPAAKNVILFVADGMGISTVTAARILEGQMRGESGEESWLSFERLPQLALSKTYAADAQVPDSAATMTAMMTGVKTKIGTLGVDERVVRGDYRSVAGTSLMTILEEAEQRGLATGVVSTATVTHATPAACYGHAAFRFWENDSLLPEDAREAGFPDLARQLVELPYGDGLEVALGGGRVHFHPKGTPDPENPENLRDAGARLDGRNLVDEWTSERPDARYVWNLAQLQALDLGATERLLGLFDPRNMKWEADRLKDEAGEPSLAEMTATAIALLSRDRDGYFLMVEGGRIDHAHHNGNAYRALTDTIAFSDAVRVAMEATDADETLIVVTADHSHAFTISGYPMRGNPILGKVVATNWLGDGATEISHDALGLPYTTLSYANGPGYTGASERQPEGAHHMHHRPCSRRPPFLCTYAGIENGRPDLSHVDTTDSEYLQEATVPMGMETHAGEDVAIYAGGPRAALFHGVVEQSYIYHAMVEALGWTKNGEAAPLE
jgi:alkaline phosphatase